MTGTGPQPGSVVVLARVSGLYGVRGWVRVFSYTSPPAGLLDYDDCLLGTAGDWQRARIAEARRHGKGLVLRLDGYDDRDSAAALIGSEIGIARSTLPDPGEGSYYWADLEGLAVRTVNGRELGRVDYLIATGANDVLVVRGDGETLIPFLDGTVVKAVNVEDGEIIVDWEWD